MRDPLVAGVVTFLIALVLLIVLYFPLQGQVDDLRREVEELRGDQPAPTVEEFTGRRWLLRRLIHRGHHRTRTPAPPPTSPEENPAWPRPPRRTGWRPL